MDEPGCNTKMKEAGNIAGSKYVVGKGDVSKVKCNTSDHRIHLAIGCLVLNVVIFESQQTAFPFLWDHGIDVTIEPIEKI